jgi:hypothetical protein
MPVSSHRAGLGRFRFARTRSRIDQGRSRVLLLVVAAGTSAPAIAAEPLDLLFGLQLGAPLAEQLVVCPQGGRHPERPCAEKPVESRDGLFWSGIRLPSSVFAEAGLVSVRGIRVVGGRVVEIELEGMAADLGRLGRSVRQRKGAPHESETIERASRVGGLSRSRTHGLARCHLHALLRRAVPERSAAAARLRERVGGPRNRPLNNL